MTSFIIELPSYLMPFPLTHKDASMAPTQVVGQQHSGNNNLSAAAAAAGCY